MLRKTKRIAGALAAVLSLSLVAAGCGSSDDGDAPDKKITLGIIPSWTDGLSMAYLWKDILEEDGYLASSERVAPGVVYTTFHHPDTQANVITTEYSDWATNCPEYKVTAVQIAPSNGPSDWQKAYDEQARHSRRIARPVEAAE